MSKMKTFEELFAQAQKDALTNSGKKHCFECWKELTPKEIELAQINKRWLCKRHEAEMAIFEESRLYSHFI